MFLFMIPMDPAGVAVLTAPPVEAVSIIDAVTITAQPISDNTSLTISDGQAVVTVTNGAPIDKSIAPVYVDNGGVQLTMTDGFTVTMGQAEADFALNPPVETDEQYYARLNAQLCEIKPWFCE